MSKRAFTMVDNGVLDLIPTIGTGPFTLWCALRRVCDSHLTCFFSISSLVKKLGVTKTTVIRYIKKLEKSGLLKEKTPGAGRKATVYQLLLPQASGLKTRPLTGPVAVQNFNASGLKTRPPEVLKLDPTNNIYTNNFPPIKGWVHQKVKELGINADLSVFHPKDIEDVLTMLESKRERGRLLDPAGWVVAELQRIGNHGIPEELIQSKIEKYKCSEAYHRGNWPPNGKTVRQAVIESLKKEKGEVVEQKR